MLRNNRGVVMLAVLMAAPLALGDGTIAGWRGDATGRYPDATPPRQWSSDRNVVWSTNLPARGNGSPVVVGDRIFVTAEPTMLLCLDRATGRELWRATNEAFETLGEAEAAAIRAKVAEAQPLQQERDELRNQLRQAQRVLRRNADNADAQATVARAEPRLKELDEALAGADVFEMPRTHDTNGYSSPTPVSDGKHVFALFGNGVVACYDMEGNRQWIRVVERPTHGWGQSSSLVLADGVVGVLINQLHGLDRVDGSTRWTADERQSFASPIVVRRGDTAMIITPSGQVVDPASGEVLARGLGRVQYNAPVPHEDVLYFIDGREGRGQATASRLTLDDAGKPVVEKLWERDLPGSRYYASPVIHDGLVYAISREERFTVMDAADGSTVYERDANLGGSRPNSAYPSITQGGGLIYLSSENGRTLVIEPGREYKQVADNRLEGFRGSPVFIGDRLYIRGFNKMWCISEGAQRAAR